MHCSAFAYLDSIVPDPMSRSTSRLRDGVAWMAPVAKSRSFWLSLTGLAALGGLFLVLLNFAIMPLWTRHSAEVAVPEVRELPATEAVRVLERAGLRPELREQPFNPNLTADIVVDQTPLPNARVKPGRRVYYYVNASPREMVTVPDVTTRAEGVARADLEEAGLLVGDVVMDTLRTPFEGTVTRQMPRSGSALPRGTRVTLWLSPGIGRNRVRVPDVTGLPPDEARRVILEAKLWVGSPDARGDTVRWHEPRPGERLREGEEVRIYTTEPPENWYPPPPEPETEEPEERETEASEDEETEAGPPPAPVPPPPPPQEQDPPSPPPPQEQPPTQDDDGEATPEDENDPEDDGAGGGDGNR